MRIGIVGCGGVAAAHLRILEKLKATARISLCDPNRERVDALAARSSGAVAATYADPEELLGAERPDVVHITSPPDTHATVAALALRAGAHVFVEKPVTETAEEYRRLSDLARARQRVLGCDYSALGMPVVLRALGEIRSGRLGRLVGVHCDFADSHRGSLIPYADANHWAYRLRGGVLQNMIDHPASLVLAAMDDIESHHVFVARRNLLPHHCPDLVAVSLKSRDQMGSFTLSMGHGCHERWAHFLLEGGTIAIDMGRQLYASTVGRGAQSFVTKTLSGLARGSAFAGGTVANAGRVVAGRLQRDPGIANVMASFYRAVGGTGELLVSERTVLAITTLLDGVWAEIDYRPGETLDRLTP